MFVDMPPVPPHANIVFICPTVKRFYGRRGYGDKSPGAHYFGRLDGGYTVSSITISGGHVVYTITRACAGA